METPSQNEPRSISPEAGLDRPNSRPRLLPHINHDPRKKRCRESSSSPPSLSSPRPSLLLRVTPSSSSSSPSTPLSVCQPRTTPSSLDKSKSSQLSIHKDNDKDIYIFDPMVTEGLAALTPSSAAAFNTFKSFGPSIEEIFAYYTEKRSLVLSKMANDLRNEKEKLDHLHRQIEASPLPHARRNLHQIKYKLRVVNDKIWAEVGRLWIQVTRERREIIESFALRRPVEDFKFLDRRYLDELKCQKAELIRVYSKLIEDITLLERKEESLREEWRNSSAMLKRLEALEYTEIERRETNLDELCQGAMGDLEKVIQGLVAFKNQEDSLGSALISDSPYKTPSYRPVPPQTPPGQARAPPPPYTARDSTSLPCISPQTKSLLVDSRSNGDETPKYWPPPPRRIVISRPQQQESDSNKTNSGS